MPMVELQIHPPGHCELSLHVICAVSDGLAKSGMQAKKKDAKDAQMKKTGLLGILPLRDP
jgi:hypothetical protein